MSVLHKKSPEVLIAIVTTNDDDIYCFRKELIEELIREGYNVLVSSPYGPKFDLMKHIPFVYDNPIIDRRGMNILADIKLFLHYLRLFKRCKPNIVLTYTAKPNVYASIAAQILGIPVINNVTGFGSILKESTFKRCLVMSLFKFSFRNSSCVMFQNASNLNYSKTSGLIRGEYRLIPGSGVNVQRYPLLEYPEGGDGKIGDKVIFNYIGRVLKDKRIDDYIEAATRIKRQYPNVEFNILGFVEPTESYYLDLLDALTKQNVVNYRGSQADITPFLKRSHCTIHPSTYGEGISNVLLESASSGRCIITTDNPGCRETVVNGQTGYVYPGEDVDSLVRTIENFLNLPNEERKYMGEEGREWVKKEFSRDKVVRIYLEQINKILNDKL